MNPQNEAATPHSTDSYCVRKRAASPRRGKVATCCAAPKELPSPEQRSTRQKKFRTPYRAVASRPPGRLGKSPALPDLPRLQNSIALVAAERCVSRYRSSPSPRRRGCRDGVHLAVPGGSDDRVIGNIRTDGRHGTQQQTGCHQTARQADAVARVIFAAVDAHGRRFKVVL